MSGAPEPPDLLNPVATVRLPLDAARQALTFAFAAAGAGDAFDRMLDATRLPEGSWDPECFVQDLFVPDLVRRCMPLVLGGKSRTAHVARMVRLLSNPPLDPDTVPYRHGILAELCDNGELERACENTWLDIDHLVELLRTAELRGRLGPIRRRLEILRSIKKVLDACATRFAGAKSGLKRLAIFAETVRATAAYRNLCDVLDHEDHLATVELRVRVGYDGELRGFEIVRADENRENPFHSSVLRRFLLRLSLWFRGYHVRQNEVLGRLVNGAFDAVTDVVVALLQVLGDLEFYLAQMGFRRLAGQKGLAVCLPEIAAADEPKPTQLSALFNPFLLHEDRPPRPCDLELQARGLVVITGPNSGGKTRFLQALAIAQLLAQSGGFAPARTTTLTWRNGLFVSLVTPVTSEQKEGRLGTELLRIRRLFQKLGRGNLVILDELCTGTNPSEGEEIFELVVTLLDQLEPQAFIITHFLRLAAELERRPPIEHLSFLQVELDDNERPTYGFLPGVATTSLARHTAERLGVTREALETLVRDKRR